MFLKWYMAAQEVKVDQIALELAEHRLRRMNVYRAQADKVRGERRRGLTP